MKYYIGEILETNCDIEYETPYVFATSGDPDEFAEGVAASWRFDMGEYDITVQGYWSDSTVVQHNGCEEITHDEFVTLRKYVSDLSKGE